MIDFFSYVGSRNERRHVGVILILRVYVRSLFDNSIPADDTLDGLSLLVSERWDETTPRPHFSHTVLSTLEPPRRQHL